MIRKSLNQILKELTPVNRADDVYSVANHDRINNIQEAIHLLTRGDHIQTGANIRKHASEGYCLLSAQAGGRLSPGATDDRFPWKTTCGLNNDGLIKVSIEPGTMNRVIPDNMFDPIVLNEGTWYMWIKCETDGQEVNSVTFDPTTDSMRSADYTTENVAPPLFYDVVSIVDVKDIGGALHGEAYQIRYSNLDAFPSATLYVSKIPDSIGEEPFTRWYSWMVQEG